jgi:uncharacterized protein (UPF0548 family)
VIGARAPSEAALAAFLASQRDAAWSYADVGATRDERLPAGHRIDRRSVRLHGPAAWERARRALERWELHAGAGVRVVPAEPPREGLTVAQVVRTGVYIVSACRVVYTIDEPDRFGFAYGTLADHPVSGEERFLLRRDAAGVTFELLAFSRARSLLFQLATPVAGRLQLALGAAYVAALEDAVGR